MFLLVVISQLKMDRNFVSLSDHVKQQISCGSTGVPKKYPDLVDPSDKSIA